VLNFRYAALSLVASTLSLVPCLAFISLGYGLAVPCISTLFSHVPVEQVRANIDSVFPLVV